MPRLLTTEFILINICFHRFQIQLVAQDEKCSGYSRCWNSRKTTCVYGQLIASFLKHLKRLTSSQWSSRGRPVKLIDKKLDALEAALRDIERFKTTVGKKTGHKEGIIKTFEFEELENALQGAWLAVEVSETSTKFLGDLTNVYTRTSLSP